MISNEIKNHCCIILITSSIAVLYLLLMQRYRKNKGRQYTQPDFLRAKIFIHKLKRKSVILVH